MTEKNKRISIVVPVYCEARNLAKLWEEIQDATRGLYIYDFEVLFVNDGSTDDSWTEATRLSSIDERVVAIDLSRNFGKEMALSAGIFHARGDAVICLDADLQHPPKYIPQMIRAWEEGAEVVEMVRKNSDHESLMRKVSSRLFYLILNRISDFSIQPQTTDFRLIDRKVAEAFNKISERQRMTRGLIDWLGFRKTKIQFIAGKRNVGDSVYSFRKLINLAIISFVSYSSLPLRFVLVVGCGTTLVSFLGLLWVGGFTIWAPNVFHFTTMAFAIVFNTLLIGIVLSALGLVALYVNKIAEEVRERPLFVVREEFRLGSCSEIYFKPVSEQELSAKFEQVSITSDRSS